MNDKAKYIALSVFDFLFTLGAPVMVIIYNYVIPTNSVGYKITLSGIVLLVAVVFTAKEMFEKNYRRRYDTLLQQLAEATDENVKKSVSDAINKHKTKNLIYQRLMVLLPFVVLYAVTWFGTVSLETLRGSVGFILIGLATGSIFNITKRPVGDRVSLQKIINRRK